MPRSRPLSRVPREDVVGCGYWCRNDTISWLLWNAYFPGPYISLRRPAMNGNISAVWNAFCGRQAKKARIVRGLSSILPADLEVHNQKAS